MHPVFSVYKDSTCTDNKKNNYTLNYTSNKPQSFKPSDIYVQHPIINLSQLVSWGAGANFYRLDHDSLRKITLLQQKSWVLPASVAALQALFPANEPFGWRYAVGSASCCQQNARHTVPRQD